MPVDPINAGLDQAVTNGGAPPVEPIMADPIAPPSLIHANIRLMLGTLTCGLIGTVGQGAGVPIPTLFIAIAREIGFTLGVSMIADKANHLKIREALRKSFREGLEAAPKVEPPAPPPAPKAMGDGLLLQEVRCVLHTLGKCLAKTPEACFCRKMPAPAYLEAVRFLNQPTDTAAPPQIAPNSAV